MLVVLSHIDVLNLTFAHNRGKRSLVSLCHSWTLSFYCVPGAVLVLYVCKQAPQVYMINEFVMEQEHKKLGLVQGDRFWTCYDTLYVAFKLSLSLSSESPPSYTPPSYLVPFDVRVRARARYINLKLLHTLVTAAVDWYVQYCI